MYTVHLADDYSRARVQYRVIDKKDGEFKEAEWCSPVKHQHFKQLENVRITDPAKGAAPVFYNKKATQYVHT